MRVRLVCLVAMVTVAAAGLGLAPGGAGAAATQEIEGEVAVPTLSDGGLRVPLGSVADNLGIDVASGDGLLRPAAADITTITLNGGAFTVRPGSTGNTFVLGGTGFSALTQYSLGSAYGAFTITNVDRSNPVQQVVTFNVPADAKGIAFLFTAEPGDPTFTPVVAFQVYIGIGAFFPLATPARMLDSRVGIGGQSAPLAAGGTWRVAVAGQAGIPADATAVSLNLTAIGGSGGGFLSLYPAGGTRPDVSSVNFGGGNQVVPNHVIVPLGQGGALDLFNGAGDGVNALIDIDGYYSGQDVAGGLLYWDSEPERVLDMRPSGVTIQPGTTSTFLITPPDRNLLEPGDVADVNVTVTNQTGVGFASVFPSGETPPNASTHNWIAPKQDTANRVAARVGADGLVSVHNGSTGTIQVIVDYFGAWSESLGYRFTPATPRRVYDSRGTNKFAVGETRWLDTTQWVPVFPQPWLVVGNLTGDQPTSATFFQMWTGNPASPPAPSNLNLQIGETRANGFIAANPFSSGSTVNLRNAFGNAHAIIDVVGSFDD